MELSTVHKKKKGVLLSRHPICGNAKVYHTADSYPSIGSEAASSESNNQEGKKSFKYTRVTKNDGQYALANMNTSHGGNTKHDDTYHARYDNINTSHGGNALHDYTYHTGFGSDMKFASTAEKRLLQSKYTMQSNPTSDFHEDTSRVSKNLLKSLKTQERPSSTKKSGSFKVLKTRHSQSCGIESTVRTSEQTMTPVSVVSCSVFFPDWGSFAANERIMPSAVHIIEEQTMTSPRHASTPTETSVRESVRTSTTSQKTVFRPQRKMTTTINAVTPCCTPHSFSHSMIAPRWQTTEEKELIKTKVFVTDKTADALCDRQKHTNTQLGKIGDDSWNFHPTKSGNINEQQANFLCFWKTCERSMKSANDLFQHVMQSHVLKPDATDPWICHWKGCATDSKEDIKKACRNPERLRSHIKKHCQEAEKQNKETRRPQSFFGWLIGNLRTSPKFQERKK